MVCEILLTMYLFICFKTLLEFNSRNHQIAQRSAAVEAQEFLVARPSPRAAT